MTEYQAAVAYDSITKGLTLRLRYDTESCRLTTSHTGSDLVWGTPGLGSEAVTDAFYTDIDAFYTDIGEA